MVFASPQMAARSTPAQTGTPLLRCGATMKTPLQRRLLFHSNFSLRPPVLTCWLESPYVHLNNPQFIKCNGWVTDLIVVFLGTCTQERCWTIYEILLFWFFFCKDDDEDDKGDTVADAAAKKKKKKKKKKASEEAAAGPVMSEHTPWIYADIWQFIEISCFIVWRPMDRRRRHHLRRQRSSLLRRNLPPSRLWRQLLSRWRLRHPWNFWRLLFSQPLRPENVHSSCIHVNIVLVIFSSPNWRNQWRTTYPRSPLSHKCHRSQLKLKPLPSRTASLLQHNKVSDFLWYYLILKVMLEDESPSFLIFL